jgi:hypothetical protein
MLPISCSWSYVIATGTKQHVLGDAASIASTR